MEAPSAPSLRGAASMTADCTPEGFVGQSRRRVEDPRLLVGAAHFVEDLVAERQDVLYAAFVRSPFAHARIERIDADRACAAADVVDVFTAADFPDLGSLPRPFMPGMPPAPEIPPLAVDRVRFVGDPVAIVVARTRTGAADAVPLVEVDYTPLDAVTDGERAIEPDAPLVHDGYPCNVYHRQTHTAGDPAGAFAAADCTIRLRLAHARVAAVALEPRGCLAEYEAERGRLVLRLSTQAPHGNRNDLAKALNIPPERVRVVAPDVGGGFGAKGLLHRDETAVARVALALKQPVAWIATRSEDLLTTQHGRDMVTEVEAAAQADGVILGLRLRTVANLGAYVPWQGAIPGTRLLFTATGCYRIENVESELAMAFTNTTPTGPYRGAGRPEATFVAERVVDAVAAALALDPVEVRRRNFIPPEDFPYRTAGGVVYDSGDYERALDAVLDLAGHDDLRRERAERRGRGEVVGIGLATYTEVAGGGWEEGHVALEPDGSVTAYSGTFAHGQGHQTTYQQVLADQLGVAPTAVRVLQGDTDAPAEGMGTYGSRSMVLGGNALAAAARTVRERALRVAAALLEAAPEDLELRGGRIALAGLPTRAVDLATVRDAALRGVGLGPDEPRELSTLVRFQQSEGDTFPFGAALAMVSIARATGRLTLERLVLVDDCGRVLNPLLVRGQLAGGAAQGIGEALLEVMRYTEDGQLATGSLLDYAPPRAADVPCYQLGHTVTPSPRNPLGVKGVGEAATVGTPAAIANAVADALRAVGVDTSTTTLPFTSESLWRLLQETR